MVNAGSQTPNLIESENPGMSPSVKELLEKVSKQKLEIEKFNTLI